MRPHCFPRLRWVALAALAIYVPAYPIAYGFANFLLKKKSDYDVSGWADDGTLCRLSLSGQPSLQHPGKSRWELMPGECETVTIGDINFDETGVSGQGCGLDPLECSTEYVFRWFAHAGRGFGRSDWGGDLVCTTAQCPPSQCTYTQGFWKTHGPSGCVTGNNTNMWPPSAFR